MMVNVRNIHNTGTLLF